MENERYKAWFKNPTPKKIAIISVASVVIIALIIVTGIGIQKNISKNQEAQSIAEQKAYYKKWFAYHSTHQNMHDLTSVFSDCSRDVKEYGNDEDKLMTTKNNIRLTSGANGDVTETLFRESTTSPTLYYSLHQEDPDSSDSQNDSGMYDELLLDCVIGFLYLPNKFRTETRAASPSGATYNYGNIRAQVVGGYDGYEREIRITFTLLDNSTSTPTPKASPKNTSSSSSVTSNDQNPYAEKDLKKIVSTCSKKDTGLETLTLNPQDGNVYYTVTSTNKVNVGTATLPTLSCMIDTGNLPEGFISVISAYQNYDGTSHDTDYSNLNIVWSKTFDSSSKEYSTSISLSRKL